MEILSNPLSRNRDRWLDIIRFHSEKMCGLDDVGCVDCVIPTSGQSEYLDIHRRMREKRPSSGRLYRLVIYK